MLENIIESGAFRRALEWFRDQCVDVVVVPGDLSDIGPDWTIPVPASARPGQSAFGGFAAARPPSFPPGASLRVDRVLATTRGGKSPDGKETVPPEAKACFKVIAPPAVKDEDARLWELEFTAETEDGAKKTKLVVPEGFNHALAHPKVSAPSF